MYDHLEKALHEAIVEKQLRSVTTDELVRELRRRRDGNVAKSEEYRE